ncbi:hypothetical protein [Largemouth bass virus]|nr:hypothetical protein OA88_22965 [Flavobacterium sp. JRM]WAK75072.1 hypothetical protein [Mandarin fish ranavirus]WEI29034.1 hypothetical protein [Largemouth bass virus]WHA35496.1 hypothetical protein MSRaV_8R [Micropterus salmoides ranavirus]WHA35601.1 hypothetical protein SCRaV_8R [Siniperca chuatsi ranavirus]
MPGTIDQETILKYSSGALVVLSAAIAIMMISNNMEMWKPLLVGAVATASGYMAYAEWYPMKN